jgi:UDP:flavonoid glycosyltransferase YjiC (YdhE family)
VQPAILGEFDLAGRSSPPTTEDRVPRVYFSLGTVFPQESGDLFQRVLKGLATLPVEVTVTIGDAVAPAELGDVAPNVQVERFLPLHEVLPSSDIVVSHGGSGTVIAALDPLSSTPNDITNAVSTLFGTPHYRVNAERLRNEASTLPDAEHAATLLETLVRAGVPIKEVDTRPL